MDYNEKLMREEPVEQSIDKKEYKAPTIMEYGMITNLVNRQFINGQDGGRVIDNDT